MHDDASNKPPTITILEISTLQPPTAMEHLFFQPDPDDPTEFQRAYRQQVLQADWCNYDQNTLIEHVTPLTPWLGFEHDSLPPATHFSDYPRLSNWNVDRIWNGELREAHVELLQSDSSVIAHRTASFLQAWLYYGLLESVIKKKILVSYLMRPDSKNINLLYSRNLHFCLRILLHDSRLATLEDKQRLEASIKANLELAQRWVTRLSAWSLGNLRAKIESQYPFIMDLICEIIPAVVRLAEAIGEIRSYAFKGLPLQGISTWQIPQDAMELRRKKMRDSKWCEFQIRLLEDTTNQSTMDWCFSQGIKQDPAGHEECSLKQCIRNNVPKGTNPQRHRTTTCRCLPIMPNVDELRDILLAKQTPVVSVDYSTGNPQFTISAVERGVPGDYLAISHVWVDGMGGEPVQGLLSCQVEWLNTLVSKVPGIPEPKRFWIDTLCIPRTPTEAHIEALLGIREVYMCAAATLVVDRLVQTCSHVASTEVLYAHIYMSAWVQRMWTYEEAVLSKVLIFVLQDDNFHTFSLVTKPSMMRTVSVVWQTLGAQLFRLRAHRNDLNIGHIYRAFRWRLTNATSEEFLSISSILTLDTFKLKNLKGDERTKAFWMMLGDLPPDMPFLDGPKLQTEGFRWAPRTMMFPSRASISTDPNDYQNVCDEIGFRGTYLFVPFLDELLHGCNQSIFMIWIHKNEHPTQTSEVNTMLRVYCNESWPSLPQMAPFDSLIINTVNQAIPPPGRIFPAVALLRRSDSQQSPRSGGHAICAYVGRILVERLQTEEILRPDATVMFEGSNRTIVNSAGRWTVRNICIT